MERFEVDLPGFTSALYFDFLRLCIISSQFNVGLNASKVNY